MTVPCPDDSGPDISGLLTQINEGSPAVGSRLNPALDNALQRLDATVLANTNGFIVVVIPGLLKHSVRLHRKSMWGPMQWVGSHLHDMLQMRRDIRKHLKNNPVRPRPVEISVDGEVQEVDCRDMLTVIDATLPNLVNLIDLRSAYDGLPLDLQVDLSVLVTKHRTVPDGESYAWSDPTIDPEHRT